LPKLLSALSLAFLIAISVAVPAASASASTALSTVKVVIVVGPVAGATSSYESDANYASNAARQFSSNVITIYTPNATWAAVSAALQGASIVVYMGHGNGLTSPYHKTFDTTPFPRVSTASA
jgi:hypothetical protein